jgi:molybdenum cofactor biosynthesis enzyme MoaA
MKISTLSIVVGSEACNATCPFCVSKMTPPQGMKLIAAEVRWDRLEKALQFAEMMDVTTVLLTGKGEPTLFPKQITRYLEKVGPRFPFVELQTNGINIAEHEDAKDWLIEWQELGLTTIAISVVSYEPEINRQNYLGHRPGKEYIDLPRLIDWIHQRGMSVRLSCVGIKGGIETGIMLNNMIGFAREHKVEQLTLTPATPSSNSRNREVNDWIASNRLHSDQIEGLKYFLDHNGRKLLTLQHGAVVYDVGGQNVCLSNCLTLPKGEEIRQAIFFPDGHLRYDWQYPGAILM